MNRKTSSMKPQDIVVLFKIIAYNNENLPESEVDWQQIPMAHALKLSQSEVSQSVARSKYAGLLDITGKRVMRQTFMDFLQYGIAVVFPVKPGLVIRGIPTAHSTSPLNKEILFDEPYVWPYAKGNERGHSIDPLYKTVPQAALEDQSLHELLALTDALRVGRAREKKFAVNELRKRIC